MDRRGAPKHGLWELVHLITQLQVFATDLRRVQTGQASKFFSAARSRTARPTGRATDFLGTSPNPPPEGRGTERVQRDVRPHRCAGGPFAMLQGCVTSCCCVGSKGGAGPVRQGAV